ncbi:MAG: PadR family transcriptional regulator [Candidatus Latescibacteria bacterium]|jgi:PadR family transcriptional regulator, regulatory protein PadR|nr:PadR family transcriptional regulator [Candidatus Latescibacterota bacterium]
MNINKELVGASSALLVLKVLARKPDYGYEIVKKVNEAADNFYTWQEGTIYPLLRKLEKEGLLRSQWESAGNKRRRKYYYITAKGRETITEGTREWNGFYQLIMRIAEVPGV